MKDTSLKIVGPDVDILDAQSWNEESENAIII